MPPARTASPASWPPMSLASSGTVAEAVAACAECGFTRGNPEPEVPGLGLVGTVGNRPAGLLDDEVLGSGGSEEAGSVGTAVVGLGFSVRTTT